MVRLVDRRGQTYEPEQNWTQRRGEGTGESGGGESQRFMGNDYHWETQTVMHPRRDGQFNCCWNEITACTSKPFTSIVIHLLNGKRYSKGQF